MQTPPPGWRPQHPRSRARWGQKLSVITVLCHHLSKSRVQPKSLILVFLCLWLLKAGIIFLKMKKKQNGTLFTADCGVGAISLLTNVQHTKIVGDLGLRYPGVPFTALGHRLTSAAGKGSHALVAPPPPPGALAVPVSPPGPPPPVYSVAGPPVIGQLTPPVPSAKPAPDSV